MTHLASRARIPLSAAGARPRAIEEMSAYMRDLLSDRTPDGDDLLSSFLRSDEHGDALSTDERGLPIVFRSVERPGTAARSSRNPKL